MCADYLSRYMENARHENVLIKFSNKMPKLKEEDLQNDNTMIPDQYKISNRPITFKELKGIFREVKINSRTWNDADGASQEVKETPAEDSILREHDLTSYEAQSTHVSEDGNIMQPSIPTSDADALLTTVNAAVAAISDGVRSIITHIPFNISTSISPKQISKDQMEDKDTAKIINTCLLYTSPSPRDS